MAHNYSAKRNKDRIRFIDWDSRSDNDFACFGLTRAQVKAAQTQLQGYIVLPSDPAYNADRMLFNPLFDAYPSMIVYCVVESDVAVALRGRLVATTAAKTATPTVTLMMLAVSWRAPIARTSPAPGA